MKKIVSLLLSAVVLTSLLGNMFSQAAEEPIEYNKNLFFWTSEKIEYTYSEIDGAFDFLGAEAKTVVEKEYDNYWHYRIVVSGDNKLAKDTIRENMQKEYPGAIYSLAHCHNPREHAYVHNIVYVVFVEPILIPDDGKPFDLNGVAVQKVLSNDSNFIFEFEYANSEDAFAAFDLFLQDDNVVNVVRTNPARDIYNVGDLNGDKEINNFDYILLKRHIMGTYWLGAFAKNADINADAIVDIYDCLLIKRHILGTYKIDFILKDNQ